MKDLIFTSILLLLFSCAAPKQTGKTAAENLYRDALSFQKNGRFLLALERINAIKSQYPYSYYATPAELLQADILFDQENYTEAAAAYILFKDFHPKHKKIEYVLYKIGDSFFRQLPSTFDRDLAPAKDVVKYSSELIRKYPDSEYATKAQTNIDKCEEMLRKKDKYIADFYFKTDVFDSASYRYLNILNIYKNDKPLREYAIMKLVASSYKAGKYSDCVQYSNKYSDELGEKVKDQVFTFKEKCQNEFDEISKNASNSET